MDAESEKVLKHLVGAGVLTKEEQAIVEAAAETAAKAEGGRLNLLLCNRNWCLVVKD